MKHILKTIEIDNHMKIEIYLEDDVQYRALIYKNDNSVKYIKPISNQSNEAFYKHAMMMIGWA